MRGAKIAENLIPLLALGRSVVLCANQEHELVIAAFGVKSDSIGITSLTDTS